MNQCIVSASRARFCVWLVLGAFVLTGLGCGGASKATVSGKVTYRGKPLPSGTVTFFAKSQIVGSSEIAEGGVYKMEDVPVGAVKISVTTPPVPEADAAHPPPSDMPAEKMAPSVPIPGKYGNPEQSGLSYEVKSGTQEHPIDLK